MSIKILSGIGATAVAFCFGLWLGRASVVRAESGNRVFELRTYTAAPGRVADVQALFRNHTTRIFKKHEMTGVGYWAPTDDPASKTTFVYMLAFPSRDAANKSWDAFRNDPEWKKIREEAQATGWPVAKAESMFLEPMDFSPLK
jgi:NIPSNAP protein